MSDRESKPTTIADRRATEFLSEIAEKPFITLVMSDGDVRVFTRGLDDKTMAAVATLIEYIGSNSDETA